MADSQTPTNLVGEKTVTTAGTAVVLGSGKVASFTILCKDTNTGKIYLGASDVASTTNDGLDPGDEVVVPALNWIDLADWYIDAAVSGEGVDLYTVKG
jgi:hypothetical protein